MAIIIKAHKEDLIITESDKGTVKERRRRHVDVRLDMADLVAAWDALGTGEPWVSPWDIIDCALADPERYPLTCRLLAGTTPQVAPWREGE